MKNNFLFVLLFFAISFIDCTKKNPDCEGGNSIFWGTSFTIDFKDALTNQYLYKENSFGAKYNKDSLRIFDEFGNKLIQIRGLEQIDNTPALFYRISAYPVIDFNRIDSVTLLNGVTIRYTIQYNYKEVDTLDCYFKVYAPPNKCKQSSFENIKVYYKQKLIHSDSFAIGTKFTILKP